MSQVHEEMSYVYKPEAGEHGLSELDIDMTTDLLLSPPTIESLERTKQYALRQIHGIMTRMEFELEADPVARQRIVTDVNILLRQRGEIITGFTIGQRIIIGSGSPYMAYHLGKPYQPGTLDSQWTLFGDVNAMYVSDVTTDVAKTNHLVDAFSRPRPVFATRMSLSDIAVMSPNGTVLPFAASSGVCIELDDPDINMYEGYFVEESVEPSV
jgi:hypothetical protein